MMRPLAGVVINFQEWPLLLLKLLQSVGKQQLKLIRFCTVERLHVNAVAHNNLLLICLSPIDGQIFKQHFHS